MRFLLDTHAVLWFFALDSRLPANIRKKIESSESQAFVSIGSIWEIAIKLSLGKLTIPKDFNELFPGSVYQSGLKLLDVSINHLSLVRQLPIHHRDPFDRLLIAQAKCEGLMIVSRDSEFKMYDVPILW